MAICLPYYFFLSLGGGGGGGGMTPAFPDPTPDCLGDGGGGREGGGGGIMPSLIRIGWIGEGRSGFGLSAILFWEVEGHESNEEGYSNKET